MDINDHLLLQRVNHHALSEEDKRAIACAVAQASQFGIGILRRGADGKFETIHPATVAIVENPVAR